ncbi:hypothetical protein SDC9_180274 [bioreactor metagenome]|uniref:Uncharacterized protein n=1 Tax=bioreactor metagenome TaxID=1076179 RepID=A0A645H945_9ZZZZ
MQLFAAPQHHKARHRHIALFQQVNGDQHRHQAVPGKKAKNNSAFGQLIGNRVQQNAKLRHLPQTARQLAVKQVCQAGNANHHGGKREVTRVLRMQVQPHKHRDQQQAKIAQQVRDGEKLPPRRPLHHRVLLPPGPKAGQPCYGAGQGCLPQWFMVR